MNRNAIPFELDDDSWKDGVDADSWPRSRYSGAAMYPGQMIVSTIVLWRGFPQPGHTYVCFEWYADEVPGPRVTQRKHEIFDLIAPDDGSARMDQGSSGNPTSNQLGQVRRFDDLRYFPRIDDRTGTVLDTRYRSWRVAFDHGWKARQKAVADQANPPHFNLITIGGKNCAKWAIEIAMLSGIDPRSEVGRLLPVPVPIVHNYFGRPIHHEDVMWEARRKRG